MGGSRPLACGESNGSLAGVILHPPWLPPLHGGKVSREHSFGAGNDWREIAAFSFRCLTRLILLPPAPLAPFARGECFGVGDPFVRGSDCRERLRGGRSAIADPTGFGSRG